MQWVPLPSYPPVVTPAPAPPAPPPAPFPAAAGLPRYGPPPATCGFYQAKDISIDTDAQVTSSFSTVTVSAMNARQQKFGLPGPSGHGTRGSGSGSAPNNGGPGTGPGGGGNGVAPGSGESVPVVVSAFG